MKRIILKVILCTVFVVVVFIANAQESNKAISAANKIEYDYFYKNLVFLSDDDLKGRDTGSEEYAIAADYVVKEFKLNGLMPFGDGGTFFQKVPLIKRSMVKSSIKFYTENGKKRVVGEYGDNFSLIVNTNFEEVREQQDLVFVGYGNIIPEKNINDYKGLDVKGKTVIVVIGSPNKDQVAGAYDIFLKVNNAINQGAEGVILFFQNSNILQGLIFKQMHGFIKAPILMYADTSLGRPMFETELKIASFAKKKLVSEIFKLNKLKLKKELKKISKGEFASKELKTKLTVSYDIKVENSDCKNVVAVLPGTDPKLKSEYVIIGGHLDHVGVGEEIKGDSIYNGMWDNATGISAIMSIAKTYNEMKEKPKRSIVFICYTGEEKGLLGSNYYAQRNDIKNGKIVANLNIDMLGSLFEAKDVIPLGYSHSNLSEAVDFSTNAMGLDIDVNFGVEASFIQRSDQMSFIQIGVPVLNVGNGYTAVNPKINGRKFDAKWMKKVYHSPFDDIHQEFSEKAFLTSLKVNFLTLYYITNVLEEIKWNTESEFYKNYVIE